MNECPIFEQQEETNDNETKVEIASKAELADEYLNLARVIQADFDNYRKRNMKLADEARQKGIFEAIKA